MDDVQHIIDARPQRCVQQCGGRLDNRAIRIRRHDRVDALFGALDLEHGRPNLEQSLLLVLLADVRAQHVGQLQRLSAVREELQHRNARPDVVVGLFGQRQQSGHVGSQALAPRNGKKALGQVGAVQLGECDDEGVRSQWPQRRRVNVVANANDRATQDSGGIGFFWVAGDGLGCGWRFGLFRLFRLVVDEFHQEFDRCNGGSVDFI